VPLANVVTAKSKKAGGAVPSANRITLLRDADGDGIAETRSVLLACDAHPWLIGALVVMLSSGFLLFNQSPKPKLPQYRPNLRPFSHMSAHSCTAALEAGATCVLVQTKSSLLHGHRLAGLV
jgi:hypothetical protein